MTKGDNKKSVITISIVAAFVFTGVILFLSLSDFFSGSTKSTIAPKSDAGIIAAGSRSNGQSNECFYKGAVPAGDGLFQSSFVCDKLPGGQTGVLNFYSDGKMIMETFSSDAMDAKIYEREILVGDYLLEDNAITVDFADKTQKTFYIVDGGVVDSLNSNIQEVN